MLSLNEILRPEATRSEDVLHFIDRRVPLFPKVPQTAFWDQESDTRRVCLAFFRAQGAQEPRIQEGNAPHRAESLLAKLQL